MEAVVSEMFTAPENVPVVALTVPPERLVAVVAVVAEVAVLALPANVEAVTVPVPKLALVP